MLKPSLLGLCLLSLFPAAARAGECSDSCRRTAGAERPGGPILSQFVDCVAACGEAAASTGTLGGMSDQELEDALNEVAKHSEIVRKSCDVAQQVQNAAALAACPKAAKRLQKAVDAVRSAQADRKAGVIRPVKKSAEKKPAPAAAAGPKKRASASPKAAKPPSP